MSRITPTTPLRPYRSRIAAVALTVAIVTGTGISLAPVTQAAEAPTAATASQTLPTTTRFVDIAGYEGVTLAANVVAPTDTSRDYPVIVLPTSWAMPQIEYIAQATKLAEKGYVVVSYNVRGFWQSGGEIEVAGPKDVADARKVIDWALANTAADPELIGMAGVSYGAGISLLTAAQDARVDAVSALSGWADLVESLYKGETQHTQATAILASLGYATGRPSAEAAEKMEIMLSGKTDRIDEVIPWAEQRSVAHQVDRLNANDTAVMLANAWGDSFFAPNQYASFYEKLSGPKRLELRPGDHATAEGLGLLGLPNDVWNNTFRWFDHHLKGVQNGIDAEQPVQLKSRSGGEYEGYASWAAVPSRTQNLRFTDDEDILPQLESGANAGISFLSSMLDQFARVSPTVSIPLLPSISAAVWQTERYDTVQKVRGTPTMRATVTSNRSDGTVVAYLYSVNGLGIGELVTHGPVSFHGKTPGQPFTLDVEMLSTAYDVPAGNRLALVIDGVDTLYNNYNIAFQAIDFAGGAELNVPLR
ncbi:CocE/NonD family hydrolase [Streptomyces sp. NPDC014882]|uniref:CocE/NonD family hydrolase n=1 Tax=Streptomyces sp. NPDC014882 TaxID=3364927 RepID=UPI0037003642